MRIKYLIFIILCFLMNRNIKSSLDKCKIFLINIKRLEPFKGFDFKDSEKINNYNYYGFKASLFWLSSFYNLYFLKKAVDLK